MHCHTLAEVRGVEQSVDLLLIGLEGLVFDEACDISGVWRQACKIQAEPSKQSSFICLGRETHPFPFQPSQNERVDFIHGGTRPFDSGRLGLGGSFEGPVRTPFRPLVNPVPDLLDLLWRGMPLGVGWRHAGQLLRVAHALVESALGCFARNDDLISSPVGKGSLAGVET